MPVDSADASLELLAQGRYDAALTSRLTGMAIVARSGYRDVLPTGPPIDDLTVSLCFASHDVDRLVQINEGLAILYRTGDYERIYRRWFARYEPTSFTPQEVAHYAAGVFFVVAVGAVWVSWHQRRLSHRVAQQARELLTMDAELAQGRRLRAVGEMVGGIAHEFNNLLTPIVLKVELLREERDADPTLQRELDVIAGAADRAATLTRRLLTFGRKDEHEPAHVHLSEIVAANVDLVLPTCDPRIALVVDVPPQLPALFQNPADLHQVVLNLLMNARDTLHDKLERDAATEAKDHRACRAARADQRPRPRRWPASQRHRHRRGHAARGARAHLRAVLHDQGGRPRHRSRTGHRLAPDAGLRRTRRGGLDARRRHDLPGRRAARKPRPTAPRPLLSRFGLALRIARRGRHEHPIADRGLCAGRRAGLCLSARASSICSSAPA